MVLKQLNWRNQQSDDEEQTWRRTNNLTTKNWGTIWRRRIEERSDNKEQRRRTGTHERTRRPGNPQKNTMKKNTMELHHRCLRRPWVREIWVRIGVSDLGFLICCSDLLFLRVSSDLLVIPLCFCFGVLHVSVLVCEISLWNSSL